MSLALEDVAFENRVSESVSEPLAVSPEVATEIDCVESAEDSLAERVALTPAALESANTAVVSCSCPDVTGAEEPPEVKDAVSVKVSVPEVGSTTVEDSESVSA